MEQQPNQNSTGEDRREFLTKYGKLALVAPPVVTMLLSTSMTSPAIAQSTGGRPRGNEGAPSSRGQGKKLAKGKLKTNRGRGK